MKEAKTIVAVSYVWKTFKQSRVRNTERERKKTCYLHIIIMNLLDAHFPPGSWN